MWQYSELFADLRSPQTGGACTKCAHFDACRGGCMAAKFFTGLPLDGPDPECVQGYGETALAARDCRPPPPKSHLDHSHTGPVRGQPTLLGMPAVPRRQAICDESPLAGPRSRGELSAAHPRGHRRECRASERNGSCRFRSVIRGLQRRGGCGCCRRDGCCPRPCLGAPAPGHRAARLPLGCASLVLFAWVAGSTASSRRSSSSAPSPGRCSWRMPPGASPPDARPSAATVSLMAASVALVHLWQGVTESHFIFFVMIGVVSLYQDWVPYGIALLMVVRCTTA